MNEQWKHPTDKQINRTFEEDELIGDYLNPATSEVPPQDTAPNTRTNHQENIMHNPIPAAKPALLRQEAAQSVRSPAEQVRDHISQLGWVNRLVINASLSGKHLKAANELTDYLVRESIKKTKFQVSLESNIHHAELLIAYLQYQPKLASVVADLCHQTRITLSEQMFRLSDEMYVLRNTRLNQIADHERKGLFTKEDADQQREKLRSIVAEELIAMSDRYSLGFQNIADNFVLTLTTALVHVQKAAAITIDP